MRCTCWPVRGWPLAAEGKLPWPSDTPVIKEPGSYTFGDIAITGIRGKHAEPYGKEFGQTNTIWRLKFRSRMTSPKLWSRC